MIISICAKSQGLDSLVDERFGRAENFVIVNLDNNEVKTVENIAKNDSSGAGGKAVKLLAENKVDIAIVPHLGPKAETAMEAFEIKTISQGEYKTVKEIVEAYKEGKLEIISKKKGLQRV
jgi:predicted Fe-Mo cluster-binding NifX family protein